VADALGRKISTINAKYKNEPGSPHLSIVRDTSKFIRMNVEDVKLSIFFGIGLAIIIVYLFLGNIRSTIITGVAIPNSLLGGFILMYAMGFTVNVMTLLALSLTVGLLIDDAIVVRENIFRKLELGMSPDEASEKGTNEVMMAVIATTVTIIIVFMPVAFMSGIVGRFFKQFGLTIVFAMAVSLFDALAVAPLLSTYFSGKVHRSANPVIKTFDRFQDWVDRLYLKIMHFSLAKPWVVIAAALIVFAGSLSSLVFVQRTFLPPANDKEFKVQLNLPSGYSLQGTKDEADKVVSFIRSAPEVETVALQIGTSDGKSNQAFLHISLIPESKRKRDNTEIKTYFREMMAKNFSNMKPRLAEYSSTNSPFPFILNIEGDNLDEMQSYADAVLVSLKQMKELTDADMQYESSAKEYQILFDKDRMSRLGITPGIAGSELRSCVAGTKVGIFSEGGLDYDIRVRLRSEQRDIAKEYGQIKIPNIRGMMIPLSEISALREKNSPSVITRQNRKRIIQVAANISPGAALGTAVDRVNLAFKGTLKPPKGIDVKIKGDNDQMVELNDNIGFALKLSIALIFLVLASLYGSFITPFTILFALPPALSGAFLALAITGRTLDIYSMIGLVMLMGLVTKNSILLVDFAVKGVQSGMKRNEAILRAGQLRLRPILMTTFAMLAGTLPVALGVGEAAKPRMSMGISIIGGIILSTVLTLVVVPAIFAYVDRLRERIEKPFSLVTIRGKFGFRMEENKTARK
jgi:HAE1 family hydrophobic/amphiphilic exporter-1